jgi:PiT family inorganic phosphate transporter
MESFFVLLALALIFDFLNGLHDSSNVVATVISSHALPPRLAMIWAGIAHFLGPFLFGVAVATTVGDELLNTNQITTLDIIAALIAAITWNLITWYFGIPSSSSHALVGGLLGAAVYTHGITVVHLSGLTKIVIVLLLSPFIGMIGGFIVMRIILWATRQSSPKINRFFRLGQILTLSGLALSHGSNDAQKTMGIIVLGLISAGYIEIFYVPLWIIVVSAAAIALGTSFGGWRLIRTLGGKIFRIRPIHGFTAQISGAIVILGAALIGGPVSTTQVLSSTIMGVGAAERISKVRWAVLRDMLYTWIFTIPVTAGLSALIVFLTQFL